MLAVNSTALCVKCNSPSLLLSSFFIHRRSRRPRRLCPSTTRLQRPPSLQRLPPRRPLSQVRLQSKKCLAVAVVGGGGVVLLLLLLLFGAVVVAVVAVWW